MSRFLLHSRSLVRAVAVLALAALVAGWVQDDPENKPKFPRTTIDFGIVCNDVEKSVKFYRDALGFTEVDGFDVPGEFAKDTGLSDGQVTEVSGPGLEDGMPIIAGIVATAGGESTNPFAPAGGARNFRPGGF